MRFEIVERDFVIRTLALLEQYDKYIVPNVGNAQQFEVTLLLNSLLGLIILPVEHCKRIQKVEFPKIFNDDEILISKLGSEWGLSRLKIERFRLRSGLVEPHSISLRQLIVMFRHCMAHGRFSDGSGLNRPEGMSVRYQSVENDPLDSLIFEVNLVNRYGATEFLASMPVEGLRFFAEQIARSFIRDFSLD